MRTRPNLIVLSVTLVLGAAAWGGPSVRQETLTPPRVEAPAPREALPARTENDLDRTIRVQLNRRFSDEPELKNREISFTVDDGDITITGTVRTDSEREKTNELAINVPGVKSVANALRVSP